MKQLLLAGFFGAVGVVALVGLTAPAKASCDACPISTKVPSKTSPGKFDYHIVCIDNYSGDEVPSDVTASTDEEAQKMAAAKCQ